MAYNSPWLGGKSTGIVKVQSSSGEWVSLLDPSSMEYQLYDLDSGDSTGRNLEGTMLRDRVAIKEKVVMEFPPMQAQDFTAMLALIADKFFECQYYSLNTGTVRTVTMYVGDRSARMYYGYDASNNPVQIWTDIKFNFIER